MKKTGTVLKSLAIIATWVCCALLLLSNLSPFLKPAAYWPVAILGILFPFLFLLNLMALIFWLFVQKKRMIWPGIALLISIPYVLSVFALHPFARFDAKKNANTLRVLSWNVGLMNYNAPDSLTAIEENLKIFDVIKKSDADVVCLQEFFTAVVPGNHYNIMDSISRTMGYPYVLFSYDFPKIDSVFYSGSVIFSRHKIIDTNKIQFEGNFKSSLIDAQILFQNDTVHVQNTRMQIMLIQAEDYKALHDIKHLSDKNLSGTKGIIQKLKMGYAQNIDAVHKIKVSHDQNKAPVIFTGDMNDVPGSYAYKTIKGNLKDVWLQKGFGFGRTYNQLSPTLRLDYVFASKIFSVKQVKQIKSTATDHYGLLVDLEFSKK